MLDSFIDNLANVKSFLGLLIAILAMLTGCASDRGDSKLERGPNGTIAYYIEVETSADPGVRIEAEGDYVGTSPTRVKVFGDKDGTFHRFGKPVFEIRAIPDGSSNQFVQSKAFFTGGFFTPDDRIPNRIFFDMSFVPAWATLPDTPRGFGTGFFVSDDGYLVTCFHVVNGASFIRVKLRDTLLRAKVVRKEEGTDLALLKVETNSVALVCADSHQVKLGERVHTMGFPRPELQGQQPKFTEGSISSLTGLNDDAGAFQISAPIQPGNSGGPLVDSSGRVIGIVVAKLRGAENVNYAIKSSRLRAILEEVSELKQGRGIPTAAQSAERIAELLEPSTVMVLAY